MHVAAQQSRSQEAGKWEDGGTGPQSEPTAEEGHSMQQTGGGGGRRWEGRVRGPITEVIADGDYWVGKTGGPERRKWVLGGRKGYYRDLTAGNGWRVSELKGRGPWTGQPAEDGYWVTTAGRSSGGPSTGGGVGGSIVRGEGLSGDGGHRRGEEKASTGI